MTTRTRCKQCGREFDASDECNVCDECFTRGSDGWAEHHFRGGPVPTSQVDQLASLARTALTDPEAVAIVGTGLLGCVSWADQASFAVDRLDEIINTLNPAEWTRESAAVALRVLGRHVAEVMDGLGGADVIEAGRSLIGDQLDGALDLIDSAIRALEEDGGDA